MLGGPAANGTAAAIRKVSEVGRKVIEAILDELEGVNLVSVRAWPGCVCLDEGVHLPAHDGFELDRPDQARGVEERAIQREDQEI